MKPIVLDDLMDIIEYEKIRDDYRKKVIDYKKHRRISIGPNVTITFEKGKIHALMGPNGSGKSTLANTIMGNPNYKVTSGKIIFNGEDITNLGADLRSKAGLFLSFQYLH